MQNKKVEISTKSYENQMQAPTLALTRAGMGGGM